MFTELSTLQKLMLLKRIKSQGQVYGPSDIVTFSTAKAKKLKELSISLTPIQSLNGYDSPWPAGGGPNMFVKATATRGWRIALNGQLYQDAGYFTSGYIAVSVGEKYIKNSPTIDAYHRMYTYDANKDAVREISDTNAVTIASGEAYVRFCGEESEIDTASFSVYENLCPITGRTGAGAYVGAEHDSDTATEYAVTFMDGSDPLTVYAGTLDVVGGELRVTGKKYAISSSDLSQNTLPSKEGNLWRVFFKNAIYDLDNTYKNGLCDKYVVKTSYTDVNNNNNSIGFNNSAGVQCLIRNDALTSSADVVASLPIEVFYPLATPLEYQLTPQEVMSLVGENTVWSEDGQVTVKV